MEQVIRLQEGLVPIGHSPLDKQQTILKDFSFIKRRIGVQTLEVYKIAKNRKSLKN